MPIVLAVDGDTLCSAIDSKPKRSARLRRIENARARSDVTVLVDEYREAGAGCGGSASAAEPASSTAGMSAIVR